MHRSAPVPRAYTAPTLHHSTLASCTMRLVTLKLHAGQASDLDE